MQAQGVSGASADSTYSSAAKVAEKTLGKDDFLKLLMTQLKNQDPLSPLENSEFIAQMAQFSSLEQINNLATLTEEMNTNQRRSSLISQTTSLIGRNVTLEMPDPESEDGSETITVKGVVTAVRMSSGWPQLVIDGQAYDPAYVSEVA